MTDRELLRRHIEAVWGLSLPSLDEAAHDVDLDPTSAPPWSLYLARLADADVALWRSDVTLERRADLLDPARRAGDCWEPALAMRRELTHAAPPMIAADRLAEAERQARVLGAADAELLDAFEPGSAAYYLDPRVAPCVGAVASDAQLVSVAHSSRQTPTTCELGIDTLPAARRSGYATAVTTLWTALIQRRELTPIYSAFAWNTPSLRLARAVGYMPRIVGVYGPVPEHGG